MKAVSTITCGMVKDYSLMGATEAVMWVAGSEIKSMVKVFSRGRTELSLVACG
jgi:hypothetical protein